MGVLSTALENLFPDLSIGVRQNNANQEFDRKLAEIDYKLERKKLHREDIRDLVELTVSRMDIYHIVGTLLLKFGIEWYTSGELAEREVPVWFTTLFLISNFCCIGYLVLSVWLAMHASVVCHSKGVRLLTSYARLPVPTRKQLTDLKVELVPIREELLRKFRGGPPAATGQLEKEEKCVAPLHGIDEMTSDLDDDKAHFRRFLREQLQWLSYDAYSRVCMSLGMNQMLQALAYFILGVVWQESGIAAICSFLAVLFLSTLIIRLDVGPRDEQAVTSVQRRSIDRTDIAAFMLYYVLPPLIAANLTWLSDPKVDAHLYWIPHHIRDTIRNPVLQSLLVTPCFILHGAWLAHIAKEMRRPIGFNSKGEYVGSGEDNPSYANRAMLPKRLRTAGYLNVLDGDQELMADRVEELHCEELLRDVQQSCKKLAEHVETTMEIEAKNKYVSIALRRDESLQAEMNQVRDQLHLARSALVGTKCRKVPNDLARVQKALDHFTVWQGAPEILANLEAVRKVGNGDEMGVWYSKEAVTQIEKDHGEFLQACQKLGLGMTLETAGAASINVELKPGEQKTVRLDAYSDFFADVGNVYFTPDGQVVSEPPTPAEGVRSTVTSFTSGQEATKKWLQDAKGFEQQSEEFSRSGSAKDAEEREADRPDHLPRKTVRSFTLVIAIWWALASFVHVAIALAECRNKHLFGDLETEEVLVEWPGPARLFRINSLQCNSSHMLVGSHYSVYNARRQLLHAPSDDSSTITDRAKERSLVHRLEVLEKVPETGKAVMVHSSNTSDRLMVDVGTCQLWRSHAGNSSVEIIRVPPTWSIVSGAWEQSCSGGHAECDSNMEKTTLRLAAWDGADVVIAEARQSEGNWSLHPRFKLKLHIGHWCARGPAACDLDRRGQAPTQYANVRALQLDRNGRMLTIMHGWDVLTGGAGAIDVWDLLSGMPVGRWSVGNLPYYAMCHDGKDLLLARHDENGPILESAPLPAACTQV